MWRKLEAIHDKGFLGSLVRLEFLSRMSMGKINLFSIFLEICFIYFPAYFHEDLIFSYMHFVVFFCHIPTLVYKKWIIVEFFVVVLTIW